MKIKQKFSIGKKGFNFNDVRQVIDLLRDKVNNDTIVVVKKSCGYFTLDECGYGWTKNDATVYCKQIDSPEKTTSCISDLLILLHDLQYNKNFLSDEIIRFGTSKPSKTGRPYSIQGILYCEQDDLVTLEFGA